MLSFDLVSCSPGAYNEVMCWQRIAPAGRRKGPTVAVDLLEIIYGSADQEV